MNYKEPITFNCFFGSFCDRDSKHRSPSFKNEMPKIEISLNYGTKALLSLFRKKENR